MKKIAAMSFLLLMLALPVFSETVDVNHFLLFPCVNGESGFIYNPSAYTPGYGVFTLGLHTFAFKANYGFMDIIEGGILFDFGQSSEVLKVFKAGDINIKVKVLSEEDRYVSVAVGLERMPIDIFENGPGNTFNAYAVASKKLWDMNISAGIKKRMDGPRTDFDFDVSKVVNDTVLAIIEYDGTQYNTGIKISISSNLNVEAYAEGLDRLGKVTELGQFLKEHFIFGITYMQ
jgi:hypothetical protein